MDKTKFNSLRETTKLPLTLVLPIVVGLEGKKSAAVKSQPSVRAEQTTFNPTPAFVAHECNKSFVCHEPGRRFCHWHRSPNQLTPAANLKLRNITIIASRLILKS